MLVLAVSENHLTTVLILLDNGASKNIADRWNKLPIDNAYEFNFTEIVDKLTENFEPKHFYI